MSSASLSHPRKGGEAGKERKRYTLHFQDRGEGEGGGDLQEGGKESFSYFSSCAHGGVRRGEKGGLGEGSLTQSYNRFNRRKIGGKSIRRGKERKAQVALSQSHIFLQLIEERGGMNVETSSLLINARRGGERGKKKGKERE